MEKRESKDQLSKRLGKHVRAIREREGLSIRELELRGEVSRGYISDLENGKVNVTFFKLKQVIDAIGISTQEFFKGFE